MPVAIDCLVDIACGNPQDEVIRILASKANKLSKRHSDKIIKLFTMSSNYYIDWIKSIIKFLSSSKQFNTQHIEQMIDISCKSNDNTRRIPILQYIFPIMLPSHLNRIFNYLKNCNQNERENAISILDYLVSNRKLDDERIVELFDILRQATPDIQRDILEVVRTSMKKGSFLSPVQINVVIEMLKSSSKDISKISADIIISCANKNKLLQQPEKLIMTLFEGTEEQVEIAIYLSENIFSKPDNQCISKIIEIFYKSDKANLRLKALFALESILDEQLFNVIDINLIIDLLKVETRLFRSDSYIESLQDSSINILYSQRSKLHQQDVDKIINCLSRLEKCLDKIPLPDKLSPCQMERIQNLLENGNEYTQINIIRFLCRHNVKKLVEQEDTLIKLLYRENPSVVLSAFYFLKKLGKYRLPSLVDAAMNCIKHIDIRVQAEAADFLSQVELSDTNNDKILAFLQSKRISMWRTQNLWRLTIDRVPSESLIEVLIFLNNCISVSSSSIVRELTKRLCSRLTSKHIQKMIDYLETEDRNLHLQVAKTIREISRYYRHFSASQVNKIICAINRLKFVDSDWYMFCFPAISGYATNEFVHKIITMFVKNPENQFIHDTMLSHIPSKLLINQVSLIVSLLETKSSEVKVGLLEVLYQITTELEPSHIEKIVCLLNGYDESVSRSAYRLLQKVHKQKGLTI